MNKAFFLISGDFSLNNGRLAFSVRIPPIGVFSEFNISLFVTPFGAEWVQPGHRTLHDLAAGGGVKYFHVDRGGDREWQPRLRPSGSSRYIGIMGLSCGVLQSRVW